MRYPYDTLGVPKDADKKTIKRAYRKKSRQLHPDVNPDRNTHDEMAAVNDAYALLTDEGRKSRFDRTGETRRTNTEEEDARLLVVAQFQQALTKATQLDEMPFGNP